MIVAAAVMMSTGGNALAAAEAPLQSVEKVLLEDDKVRVVEVYFKPGAVDAMKDRSPRVVYYFTDAHFTISMPAGKTAQRDTRAGSAAWRVQGTNEVTNAGGKAVRLTVTYLKEGLWPVPSANASVPATRCERVPS
jgi:hypothetical protein